MDDLQKLIQERDALNARIEQLQAEAKGKAIAEIKEAMVRYGLSLSDLARFATSGVGQKTARVAKYKDPHGEATWSGLGKRPQWFKEALAAGISPASMLISA